MASAADWVGRYRANRGDRGAEALCVLNDDELAEIAKGRNNNVVKLQTTIANSGGGNFISVPGSEGIVKFLHQGFAATAHLGGGGATILGFIQSNFSPPL